MFNNNNMKRNIEIKQLKILGIDSKIKYSFYKNNYEKAVVAWHDCLDISVSMPIIDNLDEEIIKSFSQIILDNMYNKKIKSYKQYLENSQIRRKEYKNKEKVISQKINNEKDLIIFENPDTEDNESLMVGEII